MKKLNNFVFNTTIEENASCFVVIGMETPSKLTEKLVFNFGKDDLLDIMFTLSYLEKVKLPTQIIVENEIHFFKILGYLHIFKGNEMPQEILDNVHETDLNKFREIVPYLKISKDIEAFYETYLMIKTLRKLCPWDRKQTHESLIPELVEEPLECIEEIKKENPKGIEEELGDVLLQILLHAEIGNESNQFTLKTISQVLFNKMYERHPHVFKDKRTKTPDEVLNDWEKNKKKKTHLNISKILASFITTIDLQEEAKYIGLEFRNVNEIFDKIREELNEVKNASGDEIKEEIGDLLFSVINLARFLNIDPAHALFISYEKFMERIRRFKELPASEKRDIDLAWEKVKKDER